jgi:hypothetical protein
LLMGILVRLCRNDYNLYQELKRRSEDINKWLDGRCNVVRAKL